MTDIPSMLALFCQEVGTQATTLQEVLLTLEDCPPTAEDLDVLTAATRKIVGVARLVEIDAIAASAEVMESYFSAAQRQIIAFDRRRLDLFWQGVNLLAELGEVAEEEVEGWLSERNSEFETLGRAISELMSESSVASDVEDAKTFQPTVISQQPSVNSLDDAEGREDGESDRKEEIGEEPQAVDLSGSSMLDLFRLEVEAQAAILNENLLALENNPQSPTELEALMRASHSIKGAARIVSLDAAVNLAHVMEDCFVAAQNGEMTLIPEGIDILFRGVDLLNSISQVEEGEINVWLAAQQGEFAAARQNIAALLAEEAISPAVEQFSTPKNETATDLTVSPQPQNLVKTPPSPLEPVGQPQTASTQARVVRVSSENLNRIMGLAGESLIEANWLAPFADSLTILKKRQLELSKTLEKLQENLANSGTLPNSQQYLKAARAKEQECRETLGDRLDELELYARRTANLSDRLYREVIASHMRPFADGVQSFPRMIRDLARKLGKQVKFAIVGKATPVDRDILKKLEAPLTHILRNAIDHGLESPSDRIAAGKSPEGTLRLEALHRGGMLAITITDDGKGIDPEQLRQKVVRKQMVSSETAERLTENELLDFLFLPGFSTTQAVTEISGRGVGLDIAKSMAQEVGGTVRAASRLGKGTSFHFQLPLTLSVLRTLLVSISGEPYAFPLARIDQIVMVSKDEISVAENREFFTMNGENIGLVAAYQVLELSPVDPPTEVLPIVVISDRDNRFGVVVDRFLGERDLVVRPLDPRLGKVPDINAAALMGDGSPILIVDVADLVRSIDTLLNSRELSQVSRGTDADRDKPHKRILIVEDSITVREMERRLLENKGYHVDIAFNGMEGWNAVRTNPYDLVISDIDMPRMNGIELVAHIKNHPRLYSIPVIIVSYKDRPEDRVQGLEAGADYYLTKSSFEDNTLLNAVFDLIGEAT